MSSNPPTFRPLTTGDHAILLSATLLNLTWNGPRFTAADILADPALAHYTRLNPARGDFGLVATRRGAWVGAVWLLLLPAHDPGYGWVAEGVPELSVCVRPGHQREGIGRALMVRALASARNRGLPAVSLSVEAGNGARALYESLGFTDAPPPALAGTMIRRLSDPSTTPGEFCAKNDEINVDL
ncbi:hypothetical protein GCM10022198_24540 [Klugiella xanthotipulae]|uniref:Acetyltransferase (GNAT) family protein n=1 Tax=Klugiella xanthotipulae TaxID=244735 RepID=A0A543I692_9MICO|nr:GNAT family N-acetyltransferase [Klugiella xanthotipulae]TQM66098.1 acetyltransferase (GNAT) family protein [Klugiella xanthotipulae]